MTKKKNEHERIRQAVAKDYARAVKSPGRSCCARPAPKGVAAKLAGYSAQELAALPADAVENSFGCGNPLAFSEVKPGDVVLDLGSGAGIDLLIAAHKVGPQGSVIGVDMTEEMIERARKNIAAAGLHNVEVRKGIIEEMPVESESVDWVISNCVINLSPEKQRVFDEIARVLKPGGKMLVSDIVADGLPPEVLKNWEAYSSCIAGAISEKSYLAGLRKAGLKDVRVKGRIVYNPAQIRAVIESELKNIAEPCCCNPDGLADGLEGKIASIKVFARKPEA